MFTWKPIYIELAEKLMPYRSRQHELLELLRSMKSSGLKIISLDDQNPKNTGMPLAEIDPFTFFACFNSVPSTTAC